MVKRLVLGLLKGLVLAGALGALFFYAFGLHAVSGVGAFMLAGLATLIAGIFAGQPPWKKGAWIGSILKGIFGFALGTGLYWLVSKFAPTMDLQALLRASEAHDDRRPPPWRSCRSSARCTRCSSRSTTALKRARPQTPR
jgi:hypothetical protein